MVNFSQFVMTLLHEKNLQIPPFRACLRDLSQAG